jgi:hypothetical protein
MGPTRTSANKNGEIQCLEIGFAIGIDGDNAFDFDHDCDPHTDADSPESSSEETTEDTIRLEEMPIVS